MPSPALVKFWLMHCQNTRFIRYDRRFYSVDGYLLFSKFSSIMVI